MALLGFTLPPDSGEKLSLGMCYEAKKWILSKIAAVICKFS